MNTLDQLIRCTDPETYNEHSPFSDDKISNANDE